MKPTLWARLVIGGLGSFLSLRAQEPSWQWGVQAAAAFPESPDLRLTTRQPGLSLGVLGRWRLSARHTLRPRLDAVWFQPELQDTRGATLRQRLETKVTSYAIGADYLYRLRGDWSDLSVGAGIGDIRWEVASTNKVTPVSGSTVAVSGRSHWWRAGFSPVATYRVSDHVELEARIVISHYGQENQPAKLATFGLLWHR